MLTRLDRPAVSVTSGDSAGRVSSSLRVPGLLVATIRPENDPVRAVTFVDELGPAAVARVRREATALAARCGAPVTVELRYVADPEATAALAALDDLAARGVRIRATPLPAPNAEHPPRAAASTARADATARRDGARPRSGPDLFGIDPRTRARLLPFLRFFFEHYWRVQVSGIEHVPLAGPAVIASNHSGAVPADAFMLAVALELQHPARRPLRVLYDRFVDQLPWVGAFYRRCGAVPAALRNAELLLEHGALVALFPEGLAGLEKTWTERYRLRPFKTGAARLGVRTGSPVIPVAIVGAEEAYPVVARLYRAGDLVGVPWIPVTPLFPLCGLAGAVPLPSKWYIRFCPPIHPPVAPPGGEEDAVRELTSQLRTAIEGAVEDLLATRAGIFV